MELGRPADADRPIRLLTFTTLYPNAARPTHGVFVENRLRHLVGTGAATSTVLAPVPYVPTVLARFERWGRHAAAPAHEVRHGISVCHPRFPTIPRVGMSIAPLLLFQAGLRAARRLRAAGTPIDLIDAHYLYPDGVAAIGIGRAMGLPVVITARGSDVTQLPDYALPRLQIRRAIARAAALIAVSSALGDGLAELGAPRERIHVLRNGVDATAFRPMDRLAERAALGLAGPVLISVGHLIERKGHDRVIAALALLPDVYTLLIVGDGPERARLASLADRLGVAARVRLLGNRPQADLPALYGAADVLVLASSREGWANVLLEAMACGTPVVASPIPGNDEVVRSAAAGRIALANSPAALAAAVAMVLAAPDRQATRAYAEAFGWEATSRGQIELFREIKARPRAPPLDPAGA